MSFKIKRVASGALGFPHVGENDRGMLFSTTDVKGNHHMLAIREAKPGAPMPMPGSAWNTYRSK